MLHCLHTTENPKGCGYSRWCPDCVVRNYVRSAARGVPAIKKKTQMELLRDGKPTKVEVQVSTSPFRYERHTFVLLMLEGLETAVGEKAPETPGNL